MDRRIYVIALLALASCVQNERPHRHGGYGRMDGGMGAQYAAPARAAPAAGTADADAVLFASFDRDGDLLVSPPELEAGIAREFARADANHDHAIDPGEYQAWSLRALGGVYPPYRSSVDVNADGQIALEEFSSELRERARGYDRNGDGVLEHAELVHAQSNGDDLQLLTPQSGAGAPEQGNYRRRRQQ